ncbi:hypothetical protein Tco_0347877, partial [Tanacetum coccineum]
EGFYTCGVHVEYEWKPPRCTCGKVFGHVKDEYPKNIDSDVVKNMKKRSQAPRGGFKPVKQVYRQVSKKNNVNTSGNKKKDAEPIIEVSNSNLFDVLLGTNGRSSNLASKKANSSGTSFCNMEVTLLDEEGKPLAKVYSLGDHDSKDKVASVNYEMANFLASKKVKYCTNSLLEQWKETYENDGYDFDPYDDDIYEGQDIPDKIQYICDNLDITIRETKLDEVVPFEKQTNDLKRKLAKNNEAKMVIYNALPRKEYERIFMCNTAKEIWKTLLITHQGNSQVKDNKIDLLVQQYEQFVIFEDESIDSAFARFNTIITSLKALDEGYSSKNYERKFLRAPTFQNREVKVTGD